MPTYVYRRPDGTVFEVFQRISDDPLTQDPETGQPVQRVISGGAGLQFKGDGFYLTDYVRKGSGGEEAAEKKGSETKAAPEKSAAKAEPKASATSKKADE